MNQEILKIAFKNVSLYGSSGWREDFAGELNTAHRVAATHYSYCTAVVITTSK